MTVRTASPIANTSFHLEVGNVNVTGIMAVPTTADWTHCENIVKPDTGYTDADYFTIEPTSDTTAHSTPAQLKTTRASRSQINLTWTASTDNVAVTQNLPQRHTSRHISCQQLQRQQPCRKHCLFLHRLRI
jgi:hypothetical protein